MLALALLVIGFLSVLWTPYSSAALDVGAALHGPGPEHWLGTDPNGRDVLSLIMKSILTAFVVSGVALLVGAVVGGPLGLLAHRSPGVGGRLSTGLSSLALLWPPLVVAAVLATNFGPSIVVSMVAIGVGMVLPAADVVRRTLAAIGTPSYVDASQLAGSTHREAVRRHLRPRLVRMLAARAVGLLPLGIIWETVLSYLGLGSQSPASSFGLMLHDAQGFLSASPLLVVFPGAAWTLMILALTLLAGGLRLQPDTGGQHGAP